MNLVIWAGYAGQVVGRRVHAADGLSGQDEGRRQLGRHGRPHGHGRLRRRLGSGDATLRLIARGDVAAVNYDLSRTTRTCSQGLKDQSYNTVDGVGYGVPHGRGANLMVWSTIAPRGQRRAWAPIWPGTDFKGKLSIYDDQIFIADAALYLKATQPDLNITNPYELDEDQFNAAVDLLKQQRPNIGEYWDGRRTRSRSRRSSPARQRSERPGSTGQPHGGREAAADRDGGRPEGGHDRWSDTWMIASKAAHPNCMYLWMDYIIWPEANAKVSRVLRRGAVEREVVRSDGQTTHCENYHADDEAYWNNIYYWNTPAGRLRRRPR